MSYEQVVNRIFGQEILRADPSRMSQIASAFDRPEHFAELKESLTSRLERLDAAGRENPTLRKAFIDSMRTVADASNWDGAYAELCFIDFLLSVNPTLSPQDLELDKTISASETLASEMGNTHANLDVYLPRIGVFMDVKVLSNKNMVLAKKAVEIATRKTSHPKLRSLPSFPASLPYHVLQTNLQALAKELEQVFMGGKRPARFNSTLVPELSYQFMWEPGVYSAAESYDPTEHGRNHHVLLFHHAKKFHRAAPSGIVFVHHPWFGEQIPSLSGADEKYFGQLARSFFCGYEGNVSEARAFNSDFNTSMSAWEASRHLSFVMFLKDGTALAEDTQAFVATNPNALNPVDLSAAGFSALQKAKVLPM